MSNDTDINNWLNYMEKLNKNLNNKKRKRD